MNKYKFNIGDKVAIEKAIGEINGINHWDLSNHMNETFIITERTKTIYGNAYAIIDCKDDCSMAWIPEGMLKKVDGLK